MSVINTFFELICALLPIPAILSLHIDKRQRWSVINVLSLSILVFLAGCVRVYYVYQTMMATYDTTWWAEAHWIASEAENYLSLVCYASCHRTLTIMLAYLFIADMCLCTGTETCSWPRVEQEAYPTEARRWKQYPRQFTIDISSSERKDAKYFEQYSSVA
jgi:hypothetical protein